MVTISVDRYRSIVKFERDKSKFYKVFIRMVVIWIAAMLFALPIGLFFEELPLKLPGTDNYSNVSVCTLTWDNRTSTIIYCTFNFICVFCIPLAVIARNYHLIMETFNSSRRRMREYSQSTPQGTLQLDSNPVPPRPRRMTSIRSIGSLREIRVMTMLILMVSLFAIMWCPIILIQFFLIMDWLHLQSWHFIVTLAITYLNVALNPIVYGLLNEQYRKHFILVFKKIRCQCCTCNLCPTKDGFDLEMEDTNSRDDRRTPVVTVCARGLELAGDVALASNGIAISNHNFINPTYMGDDDDE